MARDESVVEAYRAAMEPAFPQGVAILAGGAYGRGQTFPYSELDIVLLLDSEKQSEALKEMLPEFVRLLWNAGLRLNSAVLTIAECLEAVERASVAAFTLLDRRLLAGDGAVSEKLMSVSPRAGAPPRKTSRAPVPSRECAPCGAQKHAGPCRARRERGPRRIAGRAAVGLAIAARADKEERSAELSRAAALVSSVRCFLHYRRRGRPQRARLRGAGEPGTPEIRRRQDRGRLEASVFPVGTHDFQPGAAGHRRSRKEPEFAAGKFPRVPLAASNQEFTVARERLLLRNPAQLGGDPLLVFRLLEFIARHGVPPAPETERRLEASREAFAAYCAQPRPLGPPQKHLGCPHAALALRTLRPPA